AVLYSSRDDLGIWSMEDHHRRERILHRHREFYIMVWQVRRGIIAGRGALDAAPAGPSPAYSYLGSFSSTSLPSGSTATMPFTMTNTAGLLVVFFGVQNSKSITSVVYDPTGANVTLTQDAF